MNRLNCARLLETLLALLLFGAAGSAQEWRPIGPAINGPMQGAAVNGPVQGAAINWPVQQAAAAAQPQQTAGDGQSPTKPADESWLPEFLKHLPTPPAEPASFYQQPAPAGDYACPQKSGRPYLTKEPLLDLPGYPQTGWYASAEVEAVVPHIYNTLVGTVTAGSRNPDTVDLETRGLNWTVMPRVEIGYRLPSGFGGFSVSYRTLSANGSYNNTIGPDGVGPSQSRLSINMADFDYESWEFTPWDKWTMRWRFGGRLAYVYYDTVLNQNPEAAANGAGILQQRATDMNMAFGPHASVELTRQLWTPELSLLTRVDVASMFGRIKQDTSETAYDPASPTGVSWGESPLSSSQTMPYVNGTMGLNWRPTQWPSFDFYLGYQIEQWWNVGRLSLQSTEILRSRGDMNLNGIVFRVGFNY